MLVYVLSKHEGKTENVDRAKRVIRYLQKEHPENCYISPLTAFEHLNNAEIVADVKEAVRLDLLSVCDVLLIAFGETAEMRQEIEFAHLVGMEVQHFEG